jgi:hypothetical protein
VPNFANFRTQLIITLTVFNCARARVCTLNNRNSFTEYNLFKMKRRHGENGPILKFYPIIHLENLDTESSYLWNSLIIDLTEIKLPKN